MTYEFLDEVGLDEFFNVDSKKIDAFIDKHIVQDIHTEEDPESSLLSTESFLHIYDGLMAQINDLKGLLTDLWIDSEEIYDYFRTFGLIQRIEFVTGPVEYRVENPEQYVLYVQHDTPTDVSWSMYFYVEGQWRSVLNTDDIIAGCVPYNEREEFREWAAKRVLGPLTDERIHSIVNDVWENIEEE